MLESNLSPSQQAIVNVKKIIDDGNLSQHLTDIGLPEASRDTKPSQISESTPVHENAWSAHKTQILRAIQRNHPEIQLGEKDFTITKCESGLSALPSTNTQFQQASEFLYYSLLSFAHWIGAPNIDKTKIHSAVDLNKLVNCDPEGLPAVNLVDELFNSFQYEIDFHLDLPTLKQYESPSINSPIAGIVTAEMRAYYTEIDTIKEVVGINNCIIINRHQFPALAPFTGVEEVVHYHLSQTLLDALNKLPLSKMSIDTGKELISHYRSELLKMEEAVVHSIVGEWAEKVIELTGITHNPIPTGDIDHLVEGLDRYSYLERAKEFIASENQSGRNGARVLLNNYLKDPLQPFRSSQN